MDLALRYRLIDLARGTNSVGLVNELRALQFESPNEINLRTRAQLEDYFDELRTSLPIFKDVAKFEDLPVIDKRFINEHKKELVNPHYKGKLIRKKTGGSTGEPLVYYTGKKAQSYLWAGIFLSWEAAGYKFGDRVAFFAGPSLFTKGSQQSIYYHLLNVKVMSSFNMSPQSMTENGTQLQRGGFRLLYGYSDSIHRLARFYLDAGKKLATSLRGIVCTAETLTPVMRKDIEEAFGVPCYCQYGCHDAGVSAFECEHRNGFHLISTRSYAEVLPGGKLISTDLANRAMFLPRYDTGDIVRMSNRQCPCGRGFPLLDEVVGRHNDMVVDTLGTSVHSQFFTYMFREDERIRSYQVVFNESQLSVNLNIKQVSEKELSTLEDRIRKAIADVLVFPQLKIQFNKPFLIHANGKHRFVVRDANVGRSDDA